MLFTVGLSCIYLFYTYLVPYLYTWGLMNYGILVLTILMLSADFTLGILLILTYYLIPSPFIDKPLAYLTNWLRSLHPNLISNIEGNIRKTFPIHVLHPIPNKSIQIWHPHGITAVSLGVHNAFRITSEEFPKASPVVHFGFNMIPIARDMLRQVDAVPSDYSSIKNALKQRSIAIGLGGVEEMSKVNGKNLEFIIRKRKGIFKIALETGSPIVPVISYGENEMFPETENTFLKEVNSMLYQLFKCKLPFPSFRSAYNWTRIMREPLEPIHTYTGKPIHVKKIDEPTEKHIKALRDIYIDRLEELFKQTNTGDYTLKII